MDKHERHVHRVAHLIGATRPGVAHFATLRSLMQLFICILHPTNQPIITVVTPARHMHSLSPQGEGEEKGGGFLPIWQPQWEVSLSSVGSRPLIYLFLFFSHSLV